MLEGPVSFTILTIDRVLGELNSQQSNLNDYIFCADEH